MKGSLAQRPAATIGELQRILDDVVCYCNEVRPLAWWRRTPRVADDACQGPASRSSTNRTGVRTDTVDVRGYHFTPRYLGRLRHLNVGWSYRGHAICPYVLDDVMTFATVDGEFIGETRGDPDRDDRPKGHGFRCSR